MTATHPAHGLLAGRLLVCLGPGGVGKTTVSAALALSAAMAGRRVDVMTVDPAPRLLDALGLGGVDAAEPREVPLEGLPDTQAMNGPRRSAMRRARAGVRRARRRLRALHLDPKRTFDAIVERHAPSPAAADAIIAKPHLPQSLAGAGRGRRLHGDGAAART